MKLSESLSNGIKLITHQLPNTHCVTISISFLVGSLFENDATLGITHLIEHLFFRQFGDLSHKDLFMKTYALGAEITASTNYDCVSFNITVIPKHFREAFAIITKCLTEYHWCESLIDAEKKTVTNEIANKRFSFDNWIDSLYFENTPLSRPILGTVDTIETLTSKQINLWKDNYFCPENSCVTIIGNFSNEDYAHSISHLSGFKRFGNPSDNIICYPKNFANRNADNRYTIIDDESDLSDVVMFIDIPQSVNYETARLISSIIGEGYGSVLGLSLREHNSFTYDVYTKINCYSGFYRLTIAYTVANNTLLDSITCLFKELINFKHSSIDEQFNSNIAFYTDNQIMDYDNTQVLTNNYVLSDFIFKGQIISEPTECKEKYKSISVKDILCTFQKIFIAKNISFIVQTSTDEIKLVNHCESLINQIQDF